MPVISFNQKDDHIKRIVSKCSTLHEIYKPPWWCIGPWMNVIVMLIKEKFASNMELHRSDFSTNSTDSSMTQIVMPCPFTGPKMFCASPNFLCRTKNLFTYCASHKHFVPEQKIICIQ